MRVGGRREPREMAADCVADDDDQYEVLADDQPEDEATELVPMAAGDDAGRGGSSMVWEGGGLEL